MAYRKHIWRNGEVIKADLLNNMENGIYNEEARALEAEETLDQKIDNGVTSVTNAIGVERTRATNAEAELTQSIQEESSRATTAESNLSSQITQESTRAQGAENNLRNYVDERLASAYKASGSIFFADLPALSESRRGNVYNIKDAFTTTSDFVEGPGKEYPIGTNVAIIEKDEESYEEATVTSTDNPSQMGLYELDGTNYVLTEDTAPVSGKTYYELVITPSYLYDVLAGFIDTSDFVTDTDYATTQTAGLVKPDGTTITVDANGVIRSQGGGGDVSAEEMADVVNILGAKNHINSFNVDNNIDHATVESFSDGVLHIYGTIDQEATIWDNSILISSTTMPNGDYILSDGINNDRSQISIFAAIEGTVVAMTHSTQYRNTFHFQGDDEVSFYVYGSQGFDDDIYVYPMCRPEHIEDETYVPYAKTNRQLTMQLNADGSKGEYFNFDSHNGQYGWNETENRDLATFHPFGADDNFVGTMQEWEDEENKSKYKTVDIIDDADGFMIDTIPTHGSQNVITSGGTYNALKTKVDKSELTSISVTGDVNNTGSTIHENTYFYLNDELVKAKVDIANGAAFTLNTNYEETGDILNSINNDVDAVFLTSTTSTTPVSVSINISKYRLLLLRITNSASTVVYGSDLVPVDALKNGDVINFIRYFNVLSSNITGTLTYSSGNSFSASISNSSYVFEVYGIEALANGSSNAPSTSKADKTDLTSIIESGATASQPIASGKYFYLNGVLARAKTDIASNASFSLNVNYEEVTAGALNDSKSYVGMIIHSTTLDTMAKVVAFYGGTTWIQHSGYFLRGATSDVVANSATKTGGNDNAIVPSHTHTMQLGGEHNHGSVPVSGVDMADGYSAYRVVKNVSMYTSISSADSAHTHAIDYAGEGATNKNIPNYKSVYIWERTV